MKKVNLSLYPNWLKRVLNEIGAASDQSHCNAYLVGGCVRDILLKRKSLDVDIVIEGDGVRLARKLNATWKKDMVVHQAFKTATVFWDKDVSIDFASARKEVYSQSGALPLIEASTIEDDLFRRDFSINAMAIKLNSKSFGILNDPYDGLTDLKQKKIRVMHSDSFKDDPTRILRAIRYEQRLGFRFENKTYQALLEAFNKNLDKKVSVQRYFEEFKKVLSEPNAFLCIKRLRHFGGLKFISTVHSFKNLKLESIQQRYQELPSIYRENPSPLWLILFLSLIENLSYQQRKTLLSRPIFSAYEVKTINQCSSVKNLIEKLSRSNIQPSTIFYLLKPMTYDTLTFLRVCSARRNVVDRVDLFMKNLQYERTFLTGSDVQRYLGIKGPAVGEVLEDLFKQKINNNWMQRDQEIAYLRSKYAQKR